MSGARSDWRVLVKDGDTASWFFADLPTEEEASLWLPAMYAIAEAMAQRLNLQEDAFEPLLHAVGEAMASCTVHTSPLDEQTQAVEAAKRVLDTLISA